ncbi:hypothetical protein SDC9_135635 [bioreactor metagenome]|uniref:Uncharacterized protein n=1 Tax=bioreactor metagenome TaxID=1076179 RepID=A0A645DH07_9ZZZZ
MVHFHIRSASKDKAALLQVLFQMFYERTSIAVCRIGLDKICVTVLVNMPLVCNSFNIFSKLLWTEYFTLVLFGDSKMLYVAFKFALLDIEIRSIYFFRSGNGIGIWLLIMVFDVVHI